VGITNIFLNVIKKKRKINDKKKKEKQKETVKIPQQL
jgi:hypothetical protein